MDRQTFVPPLLLKMFQTFNRILQNCSRISLSCLIECVTWIKLDNLIFSYHTNPRKEEYSKRGDFRISWDFALYETTGKGKSSNNMMRNKTRKLHFNRQMCRSKWRHRKQRKAVNEEIHLNKTYWICKIGSCDGILLKSQVCNCGRFPQREKSGILKTSSEGETWGDEMWNTAAVFSLVLWGLSAEENTEEFILERVAVL